MIELIQGVHTALEAAKKLRELAKKIEDADIKILIADLSNDLADVKIGAAELKEKVADLLQENARLRQALEIRDAAKPAVVDDVYQFAGETGLFCTGCYDNQGKKIRVKGLSGPFTVFGKWECPACKAQYGPANLNP